MQVHTPNLLLEACSSFFFFFFFSFFNHDEFQQCDTPERRQPAFFFRQGQATKGEKFYRQMLPSLLWAFFFLFVCVLVCGCFAEWFSRDVREYHCYHGMPG